MMLPNSISGILLTRHMCIQWTRNDDDTGRSDGIFDGAGIFVETGGEPRGDVSVKEKTVKITRFYHFFNCLTENTKLSRRIGRLNRCE